MKVNRMVLGGSIILLITINLYNALNFGFQWAMARMLSVTDYREIVTLISIVYFLTIFSESIQLIISKYSSMQTDTGKLKNLLFKSARKSVFIASIVFLLYLVISIPLSRLIKIDYFLVATTGLLLFTLFIAPVTRGILQGRKKFAKLGFTLLSEGTVKLSLGILLVLLGFGVFGAIVGIILSTVFSLFVSLLYLKEVLYSKEKPAETPKIYSYTLPVFLVNFVILVFSSIDIILAGMLFSEQLAGEYAIASVVAKSIFLATSPVSKAMFPISSESKVNNHSTKGIFFNAFAILLALLSLCLIIFYLFPEILVKIFSGKILTSSIEVIFPIAVAFSLLSISNLILYYKLSTGSFERIKIFIIFVFIMLFLILFFSLLPLLGLISYPSLTLFVYIFIIVTLILIILSSLL